MKNELTSLEICAGAGGQALGLEQAGFKHVALVEIDKHACNTLRYNRPNWNVIEGDVRSFDGKPYHGVDLLCGGVPCPPFSKAGKQLGADDERDMFPQVIRLAAETSPKAIMIENVRGLLDERFKSYRHSLESRVNELGYTSDWRLLNSSDFGVSQLRPRVVFICVRNDLATDFSWPIPSKCDPLTVGQLLVDLMSANGWQGAKDWAEKADSIAPTLVGGSKKHGGPDLGPTRSKKAWEGLCVDGSGLWDNAPQKNFTGFPRLTPRMTARLQGFPDEWLFYGKKTSMYRQIGNAFPPPVAKAIGIQLVRALLPREELRLAI